MIQSESIILTIL